MTAPDIARIRALAEKADPALGPLAPVLLSKQNVLALCEMAEIALQHDNLKSRNLREMWEGKA